ncbi:hypothetical protein [Nonomuraea jabiensis]|uniref:hypothetical protein n=1 Tax=Nonomuraea jabiensis TaxID=882448 RepID=UPI003D712679
MLVRWLPASSPARADVRWPDGEVSQVPLSKPADLTARPERVQGDIEEVTAFDLVAGKRTLARPLGDRLVLDSGTGLPVLRGLNRRALTCGYAPICRVAQPGGAERTR